MKIGYACQAIAVPGSTTRSCMLKNATPETLLTRIGQNLEALDTLVDYNIKNGILLFRISSDLIPFGSSIASNLSWDDIFAEKFALIGDKIRRSGMRVSLHPGQYTVLNSTDRSVVERAILDLHYHARLLDALQLDYSHKLILHIGGAYGDKKQAKTRFIENFETLHPTIQNRLALENDDKIFTITDVLEVANQTGSPVVFDNLHHLINPPVMRRSDADWIRQCAQTWQKKDGRQKVHYSQQCQSQKPGAHSQSIAVDPFLVFSGSLTGMDIDIMLEVKDKNLSALKCLNCSNERGMRALEEEWAHYKYCVLEHSPQAYNSIRQLLRDKTAYPALTMYHLIERTLTQPILPGNAINASQHVWGYFKENATPPQTKHFLKLTREFTDDSPKHPNIKMYLLRLARIYGIDYLLRSYYFFI